MYHEVFSSRNGESSWVFNVTQLSIIAKCFPLSARFLFCFSHDVTYTLCLVLIYKRHSFSKTAMGKKYWRIFRGRRTACLQIFLYRQEIVFIFLNENTHSSRGNFNLDKYLLARFLNYIISCSLSHLTESYLCRIKVWYFSLLWEKNFFRENIKTIKKISTDKMNVIVVSLLWLKI